MKEHGMTSEPSLSGLCALWRDQPPEGGRMSVADVRRKSEELQEHARRRASAFYLAAAGNIGIPLLLMCFLRELRLELGYLVATAVFLTSFVRRRSAIRTVPPAIVPAEGLAYFRELLERERDFRRDSTRWFTIGPALNILVLAAGYVMSPLFHGTAVELSAVAFVLTTHVLVLARLVQRLRREARILQLELDALDGLSA
jgi:hypothetical protein